MPLYPRTGYLIHKEGRGWYRPLSAGYTTNVNDAGRYTREMAILYCQPNGPDGPQDGLSFQHERHVDPGTSCEKDLRIHDLLVELHSYQEAHVRNCDDLAEARKTIDTLQAQLSGACEAALILSRSFS